MGSSVVTVEKFVAEQRAMYDNSLLEEDLGKKVSIPAITLSMDC